MAIHTLFKKIVASIRAEIWTCRVPIPRRLKGKKNPFREYIDEATIRDAKSAASKQGGKRGDSDWFSIGDVRTGFANLINGLVGSFRHDAGLLDDGVVQVASEARIRPCNDIGRQAPC
jgi:hypothetical protein